MACIAIVRLVKHRLGAVPAGFEEQLSGLELDALQGLFDRVVEVEDPAALEALVRDMAGEG